MTTVDPTKPKQFVPVDSPTTPAPKNEPKNEPKKAAVDLEKVPDGPKPNFAGMFPQPKLSAGPGVSGSVFGPVSPNIKGFSDAELASAIAKQTAAMRANPGKVNEEDFKLLGAMTGEAAERMGRRLDPSKDPKTMSNQQLFETVVAYDTAKASGVPLTPEQKAHAAKCEAVWTERKTVDPKKELAALEQKRVEIAHHMAVHCAAVPAGMAGLAGFHMASNIAAGYIIYDALKHKQYGHAVKEGALLVASKMPGFGKYAEGIATADYVLGCASGYLQLQAIEKEIAAKEKQIQSTQKP